MTTYGDYTVLHRIAAGGMGEVFLAEETQGAHRKVALKRIFPHLAEDQAHVSMFLDEARIAGRLDHPNLARVVDLGVEQGAVFLAFEYVHGGDLRRIEKRCRELGRPLTLPAICRIGAEVCNALEYAHRLADPTTGRPLGIVHRDISPQNIMVSTEGEVKVVDFGIAKAADSQTRTLTGVVKGKQPYMSPEQAAAQPVDHRSDLFSLGTVLYELATGKRLFKRDTDFQTIEAVLKCEVRAPSTENAGLPGSFDDALLKALEASPGRRFPTAAAMGRALEEVLEGLPDRQASSRAALGALAVLCQAAAPQGPALAGATDKLPAFLPPLPRTQDVSVESIQRAIDRSARPSNFDEEETIRPGTVPVPVAELLSMTDTDRVGPAMVQAARRMADLKTAPLGSVATVRDSHLDADAVVFTPSAAVPATTDTTDTAAVRRSWLMPGLIFVTGVALVVAFYVLFANG